MNLYWRSNCCTLPDQRLNESSNKYLYKSRFIELAWKKYYLENDNLYYIKKLNCVRLDDGGFEDKTKVILKRIPFIYEIYPYIKKIHDDNNHAPLYKIIDLVPSGPYYCDSIEFCCETIINLCPECIAKFNNKPISINNSIITDLGPHYRYLVDITYLKDKIYKNKTKYLYIIDFIDHFSKF